MTDDEVKKLFDAANELWSPARIRWNLESLRRTPAHGQGEFKQYAERVLKGDHRGYIDAWNAICPQDKKLDPGWNVYIVAGDARFGLPRGAFLKRSESVLFCQWKHTGYGERIRTTPATFAHELGHTLGLPHVRENRHADNLMVPSVARPDAVLFFQQVRQARDQVLTGHPFSMAQMGVASFRGRDRDHDDRLVGAEIPLYVEKNMAHYDIDQDGTVSGLEHEKRYDVRHEHQLMPDYRILGADVATGASGKGVLISEILPGHPGDAAGLKLGDRLLLIDGNPVNSKTEMNSARDKGGITQVLVIERDGARRELTVKYPY